MMKNKKVEANLSMVVSKTFSGLNMNALKYLLPVWVSPLSGVTLRCVCFLDHRDVCQARNFHPERKNIPFSPGSLGHLWFHVSLSDGVE